MMLIIGNKQSIANGLWSIVKKKLKSKDERRLLAISHKPSAGFTLVEVMVTVVVLSVGLVAVYEAFLVSLDTMGIFHNRLNAQFIATEQIDRIQRELNLPTGTFLPSSQSGIREIDNRKFAWQLVLSLDDINQELYSVNAIVLWKDAQRERSINRQAYVKKYFSNSYP